MPIFKVTGFEKSSARSVTWYLDARSEKGARDHAARGGLVDAEVAAVDRIPPEVSPILVGKKPRESDGEPSLFWVIVGAILVGNLATAAIMKLLGYLT